MIIATGLPAAYLMKERVPIRNAQFVEWKLFKDVKFSLVFAVGVLSTFPLFVPPFFLPLYSKSLGLSSATGAGLLAAFNFCSAVGRLGSGFACDKLGSLTTLFLTLILSSISLMVIWPLSNSIGPLVVFIIINGMANGGFFSTMPTVVGNVFGSARVGVAMGMIVSGWIGGYLMVSSCCLIKIWRDRPSITSHSRAHRLLATSWMHPEEWRAASDLIVQLYSMLAE